MSKKKRILGIDPGTTITGYGIIETSGNSYEFVECGVIKPNPNTSLVEKYVYIFDEITKLVTRTKPIELSVETQFVQHNIQTAMKLGMARGAIIIAAAKLGVDIFEYSPSEAKRAVTGNGRSSKPQVAHMTKVLLSLTSIPTSEDASDALSLAIAHAHQRKF